MLAIDWTSKIEDFLLDNNCYAEFIDRLLDYMRMSLPEYINFLIERFAGIENDFEPMYYLVGHAFIWDDFSYWADIHRKWNLYVSNLIKHTKNER